MNRRRHIIRIHNTELNMFMMYTYNTKRIEYTVYTNTLRFEVIYYLYMQHHFRRKAFYTKCDSFRITVSFSQVNKINKFEHTWSLPIIVYMYNFLKSWSSVHSI